MTQYNDTSPLQTRRKPGGIALADGETTLISRIGNAVADASVIYYPEVP